MPAQSTQLASWIERAWDAALTAVSRLGAVVMSSRGLVILALLGCGVLATGPWLRPAISRDFRAIQIPWTDGPTESFLPEFVAEVPRPWRLDSVAIPLLVVILAGIVIAGWRPQWTSRVFGILLAVSISAVAAVLWNHPGLIEFFEGEVRERGMLRVVYRQRNEDTLTNRAPDRLRVFGEKYSRETIESPVHPIMAPFRYSVYGPWLIAAAFVGTVATRVGRWPQRLACGGVWVGVGLLLAAAVTGPRWAVEYHWAQAEAAENSNQLVAAEQSLAKALNAMPQLADTSRYWLTTGRLAYRQQQSNQYADYFEANQYLVAGRLSRARALIEHSVRKSGGVAAQRALLAEVIGHIATRYGLHKKYGAAEIAWGEAADIAPWKPAYWIGQAVTVLASDPTRAAEVEIAILPRMRQVGDCFVSSDFASMLGDAYFEVGSFYDARDMYSKAMNLFHLPKHVNLHAQEGRLGM